MAATTCEITGMMSLSQEFIRFLNNNAATFAALNSLGGLVNAIATFFILVANVFLAAFTYRYVKLTDKLLNSQLNQMKSASDLIIENRARRAASVMNKSKSIRVPLNAAAAVVSDLQAGLRYLELRDADITALEVGSVEVGSEAIGHASLAAYLLRLILSRMGANNVAHLGGRTLDDPELASIITKAVTELQALERVCEKYVSSQEIVRP